VTFLDGYLPRIELAAALGGISTRTIARYERERDGLPYTLIGGKKFYRIDAVREWLAAREHRPNPSRRGKVAA